MYCYITNILSYKVLYSNYTFENGKELNRRTRYTISKEFGGEWGMEVS